MKTYYIVRHGKTQWNMLKKTQGSMDSPLTEEGIACAKSLRERLKVLEIDRVYSSDLKRAVDTAKILMPSKEIELIPSFREINFGQWEGMTISEIQDRYELLYSQWRTDPAHVQFIDGESMQQAYHRVREAFWHIDREQDSERILIVSHAMIIKLLIVSILEAPIAKIFQLVQGNLALNVIRTEKGIADIITMNDTTHIEQIE